MERDRDGSREPRPAEAGEVDATSARAFLGRGWAELERLDREHWARRHADEGPRATWAAANALREHVRRVRPDWPGETERASDLEHHLAWKRLLANLADRWARAVSAR